MKSARTYQNGSSLIEVLVASSIGLLVILAVTSLFLKSYESTSRRSLELLLHQDVNDALRLIKEDILRAGYQSGANSTLKLSGAFGAIGIKDNCIAIVYTGIDYINYSGFRLDDKKLKFYQDDEALTLDKICKASGAYSLLYDKQIDVTNFSIENIPLGLSSSVRSQLVKLTLEAELKKDPSYYVKKEVTVKVRNWSRE
jgi:type IV pilus assembly protein PilW